MSSIGTDGSALSGSLTPTQTAELALFGGGSTQSTGSTGSTGTSSSSNETPQQQADAALVDLSAASTVPSVSSMLANGSTPLEAEASELVSSLSADITASGSSASSVYSQLSAYATYALTKS